MIRIAESATAITPTQIREITKLAKPTSLHLGIGQPDLPMPDPIRQALNDFAADGYAPYVPNAGTNACREQIARVERCAPNEVLVTCGVQQGLAVAILGTVNAGDSVLVPNPGFPAYENLVRAAGGVPIEYELEGDWSWSPGKLETLLAQHRPVAIVLNNPANPTGVVQRPEVVERIAKLCARFNVTMISDEIYAAFVYGDAEFASPRSFAPQHTIALNGLSKSHAAMGLRVGWMIAPEATVRALTPLHQHLVTSAPTVSQHAAQVALKLPGCNAQIRETMARRAARATALATELCETSNGRCSFVPPTGAFYLMLRISDHNRPCDDMAVARALLEQHDVVTIPGSGFGVAGAGHLRIAYPVSEDILIEAFGRMRQFFATM